MKVLNFDDVRRIQDMKIVATNIAGNMMFEWGLILDMNMITMTWEKYIP